MTMSFVRNDETAAIRRRLSHPVIDADGHQREFVPLVKQFLGEVAGPEMVKRFEPLALQMSGQPSVEGSRLLGVGAAATGGAHGSLLPTLDLATARLPGLMYARMDELGLDFALVYPTVGLAVLGCPDADLRPALARALNRYYAELYAGFRDRLEPVAVIPMFSPEEALAELEYAIGTLGLKAVVMGSVIPRRRRESDGREVDWLDLLGHESAHDYGPVWARCLELGVTPTFHSPGYGWGTRASMSNHVYNHLGHFGVAGEGVCRSLLMSGVPQRLPGLRFAFLEGGVSWACQLYADLLSHFEKRNKDAIAAAQAAYDFDLFAELVGRFAHGRIASHVEELTTTGESARSDSSDEADDFAEARLGSVEDIVRIFTTQFNFGCEADDPLNALAFDRSRLPNGIRLNALYASDIGHWDVPDMRYVLPEAWELVEHQLITEEDFSDFTYGNVMRMLTATNPTFFEGTGIDDGASATTNQ